MSSSSGVRIAGAAQRLQQHQAVDQRQHAVEHDRVELFGGGQEQSLPAIGGVVDGVPVLAQALDDEGGGVGIVFDQQDSHAARLRQRKKGYPAEAPRRGIRPLAHGLRGDGGSISCRR